MIDTAGRMQDNAPLMRALAKVRPGVVATRSAPTAADPLPNDWHERVSGSW